MNSIFSWKQAFKPNLNLEIYRTAVFAGLLLATSVFAKSVSIPGVPYIHVELILLSPFLNYRWGLILISVSLLTSAIRAAQGLYGFDQLFVAAYFVYSNFNGIPEWVNIAWGFSGVALTGALVIVTRKLPKKYVKINFSFFIALILACIYTKSQEDNFKTNLVGSSFGYLLGQLQFSEMFYGPYVIPMAQTAPYPTRLGAQHAINNGTNLTVFLVESLGVPTNQHENQLLLSNLYTGTISKKYLLIEDQISVRGSTIHGEIRELCNGRLENGLEGDNRNDCIPSIMSKHGYYSTAIHANNSSMYGRSKWYPQIGFNNYINSDTGQLPISLFKGRWGTTLDTNLIDWLQQQDETNEKTFLYVLTVSTHLPAISLPGAKQLKYCQEQHTKNACIHIANLKVVMDKIVEYAELKNNTTIVIVGDHPPPFANPSSRAAFKELSVPYVILTPKEILSN